MSDISPLHLTAQQFPQQIAIKTPEQAITYSELSLTVFNLGQQLLSAGLNPGDKLACISSNNVTLIYLYWACVDMGVIFFPISPRFPSSQVQALIDRYHIGHYWRPQSANSFEPELERCHAFTIHQAHATKALPYDLPKIDVTRPSNVILTSGSSGFPKAAVHCLANHIANAQGSRSLIDLSHHDAWLLSLPLFHIGGLAILNRCALVGASIVMPDESLPLCQQVARDRLSHISLVPAQVSALLDNHNHDINSIKALLLGGGAVPSTLLATLAERGIATYTSYGMTEMGSQITTGPALSDGSSGKLLPHRELKIVDDHIWVRGACLFLGYLAEDGLHTAIDDNGWFYTKDRGEWDTQGNLRILGRADNMFICGGENIQPEEIEAALKQHPQIDDAIVFAQTDDKFGYLPAAIIRGSVDLADSDAITQFLSTRIARFKRPRYFYPWPDDVKHSGLKINRKAVIAALRL